jgi:DNA polymerase III epsilon subunit-like protein
MSYNPNLIIVFDTETTGFSPVKNEVVQLSYILYDVQKKEVVYATKPGEDIVNIKGNIPKQTSDVHGITKDMTLDKRSIKEHIDEFIIYCNQAGRFVGHNIKFDIKMITGQMLKIIKEFPETEQTYKTFLERFQMIKNDLPEAAYCTMIESQGICAQILNTNKLKYKKLMEVHKLLFNQDVGGQLHNALVDISVTLRVYLKLTMDIDICENMTEFSEQVDSVKDNYTICSLIKPVPISAPVENVNYTGEIITGLNIKPDGLEEEKVMVQSIAKKFVSQVTTQAISNITSKISPQETICTNISICRSIIKLGKRSGQECGRPATINNEFCGYHKPNGKKIAPELQSRPVIKPQSDVSNFSQSYVNNLFKGLSKKNKVTPLGGKKRKTRKHKNKRKSFKRRKYVKN